MKWDHGLIKDKKMKNYLKSFFLYELLLGMKVTFLNMFKKENYIALSRRKSTSIPKI